MTRPLAGFRAGYAAPAGRGGISRPAPAGGP